MCSSRRFQLRSCGPRVRLPRPDLPDGQGRFSARQVLLARGQPTWRWAAHCLRGVRCVSLGHRDPPPPAYRDRLPDLARRGLCGMCGFFGQGAVEHAGDEPPMSEGRGMLPRRRSLPLALLHAVGEESRRSPLSSASASASCRAQAVLRRHPPFQRQAPQWRCARLARDAWQRVGPGSFGPQHRSGRKRRGRCHAGYLVQCPPRGQLEGLGRRRSGRSSVQELERFPLHAGWASSDPRFRPPFWPARPDSEGAH